jgi:hypothetical protein
MALPASRFGIKGTKIAPLFGVIEEVLAIRADAGFDSMVPPAIGLNKPSQHSQVFVEI